MWALFRLRHPLLAAHVVLHAGPTPAETDYSNVKWVYQRPDTIEALLEDADHSLEYKTVGKDGQS